MVSSGVEASPAVADGGLHHVYRTDGDGAWLHSQASLHNGLVRVLPEGSNFVPQCYSIADIVNGNPVWLYGSSGESVGFVSDFYVDTHWDTLTDLDAQGIVPCDEAPSGNVAQSPPESSPAHSTVNLQLSVFGTREQNLVALTSELQAAADAAGVDGQELARVIYHEGGNYLGSSARRSGWSAVEEGLPGDHSVGIGQIKVATARMVESKVYGGDEFGITDEALRSRLIHDTNFAIYIAAGYLRIMQDEGLASGWPQFMAYSLGPEKAAAWKAAGHPMDVESLNKMRMNVSKFQQRQQFYNDAVAAIG
jgi:hypothetical protein